MNWCYVKETWEGFELNQITMSLRALEQFLMIGKTLFKSYERWALGIGQPEVVTVTKIGGASARGSDGGAAQLRAGLVDQI